MKISHSRVLYLRNEGYMYKSADELLGDIQVWDVLRFHGKIHTPQEHYQVVLNAGDATIDFVCMSVATSQIEKRERYIQRHGLDEKTLVTIEVWEVSFFSKRTCFNCNDVLDYNKHDLFGNYLSGALSPVGQMPESIMGQILEGVRMSPMVSPRFKKMIFGSVDWI